MPKRKKYPRLPNGYGSIKFLGRGRRNPYGVYPPAKGRSDEGVPITPPAICYTDSWVKGFAVLTAYHAGTYTSGYELTLNLQDEATGSLETLARRILADYNQTKGVPAVKTMTLAQLYEEFYSWKFERDKSRSYSRSTHAMIESAYKHTAAVHGRDIAQISFTELQDIVDSADLRHAGKEHLLSFLKQIFGYAVTAGYLDKSPAAGLRINIPDDDEKGVPFTDSELALLWRHADDPTIEMLLILSYSGWRIAEVFTLSVDLEKACYTGGIKTQAGKNRLVPIHSSILPLVARRMERFGCLLPMTAQQYRVEMRDRLEALGILGDPIHTPHDCRHTFSRLCEKYGVRENDRKRMLGHSFGDITNRVYGHRELDDLRREIEKISLPPKVLANCG